MSKWKAALLTAASSLSALLLGGCLDVSLDRVMELVAIGSIFD
ncbi:MAG: hypothetical protein ACYTF1_03985 [Planctomycetota bacterium]